MIKRIVVVTKATSLEELQLKHYSDTAIKFHLATIGERIDEYQQQHSRYYQACALVKQQIPREVPYTVIERSILPSFLFRETDLVVVCGPDGLFVNVAKLLTTQPVITINPDPERIDGVLMKHAPDTCNSVISRVLSGDYESSSLTLAEAELSDGRILYAVNDFLIGRSDQKSSYYSICQGQCRERQSSSGILVSTGVGTTGWLSSIMTLAESMTQTKVILRQRLPEWESDFLTFVVREPFPSKYTQTEMIWGVVSSRSPLQIISEMPTGGTIISDGITEKAVQFNTGTTVSLRPSSRKIMIVG